MMPRIRRFCALFIVACAVLGSTGLRGDAAPSKPKAPAVAAWQLGPGLIEVHIRRLHLVRPDLIPYPIAYEAIC